MLLLLIMAGANEAIALLNRLELASNIAPLQVRRLATTFTLMMAPMLTILHANPEKVNDLFEMLDLRTANLR